MQFEPFHESLMKESRVNVVPGWMPADPTPRLLPGVVGLPAGCLALGGWDRQGAYRVFAGTCFCSFDPKNSLPSPGLLSAGESLLLNFFFPKRIPVPISMDQLGWEGAVGRGGVEQLKFSKERNPAGPHIKGRWQPPQLILAPTLGHRDLFIAVGRGGIGGFHASTMTNWRTAGRQRRGAAWCSLS